MALNDVSFQLGQGGLGRPLPGEDYISGIIFYNSSPPAAFQGTGNNIKQVFQTSDAEALGITNTYSDEVQATATFTVSAIGAIGDVTTISVAEPSSSGGTTSVTLGSYTQLSTDSSASTLATNIAAAINIGTLTHGYKATVASGVITITARVGLGTYLNTASSPLSYSSVSSSGGSGTITVTIVQFGHSGTVVGVASKLAVYHYHISEYFRIINAVSGQGNLYVGFFSAPDVSGSWAEIASMQNFADGTIRQLAIYNDQYSYTTGTASTFTGAIQGIQAQEVTLDGLHMPLSIVYACDFKGVSLAALSDLSTLNSSKVSIALGQDGAAQGWSLFEAYGKSITCLGATLGAISAAAVSEDIAWVGKFDLSDGTELDTAAFATGDLYRTIANSELTQIDNQRYIFLRKFIGQTGTYFNDSHCAILQNSDYAYIENNRTIDKAKRGMYVSLLPALNSPLTLNSDGTLANTTISYLETLGEQPLQQMQRDGDLSNYQVTIDATQNVLSTSIVKVNALIQPQGVARNIQVTIGYTTSIQ